jgi:hypothetical protein
MSSVTRRLVAPLALAVAAGSLTVLTVPAPASASGCLSARGVQMNVETSAGYVLGKFYQGYNACNNSAYAEFHFTDLWVSRVAGGSSIAIEPEDGYGGAVAGDPHGTAWWDAAWAPLAGHSDLGFTASFTLKWNGYTCEGHSSWDYATNLSYGYETTGDCPAL